MNVKKKILICSSENTMKHVYKIFHAVHDDNNNNNNMHYYLLSYRYINIVFIICILQCRYNIYIYYYVFMYSITTRACFSIAHNQSGMFFDWE